MTLTGEANGQDSAGPSGNISILWMRPSRGAASETVLKFISKSDPAAQWTGAHKGHAFFAYADNYLIDLKAAIIVDVDVTRAILPSRSVRRAP